MTQRRTGLFWALFAAILAMLLCRVGAAEGEERKLVLDDLPDTVNLYKGEQIGADKRGHINVCAHTNDWSAIDKVDFAFICREPENNVLCYTEKYFHSYDNKESWHMSVSYAPACIGKCIYTVTASIPGTDYKLSKDITFIVRDRISSVPSIEINRNYFNERNEYIGELMLPDDGSPLEIVLPEEAIPSYTLDDTKIYLNPCAGYCSDGSLNIGFSKAGNHTVEFKNLDDGSNLDLSVALTFIVKSNAKPENLTPVLSGVPEDDMLISYHQSN